MNIRRLTFLTVAVIFSSINSMEKELTTCSLPKGVQRHICVDLCQKIHTLVTTPEEAQNILKQVGLVSKDFYDAVNDPLVIKNVISNLSKVLRHETHYIFYEETIAQKLNTVASKKYLNRSQQLFSLSVNKNELEKLLNKGVDPNYRKKTCLVLGFQRHSIFIWLVKK